MEIVLDEFDTGMGHVPDVFHTCMGRVQDGYSVGKMWSAAAVLVVAVTDAPGSTAPPNSSRTGIIPVLYMN